MDTTPSNHHDIRQSSARFDFSGMAGSYDQWYATRKGRAYDAVEKRAVAKMLSPVRPDSRLLEVGCGTGHWSAFFAEKGFDVSGMDISADMVAVARRGHAAHGTFQVGDAHAIPFDNGEFDVTVAITTLEFVRDAEAVVREMARCTRRPGGVLLVGVLNSLAPINVKRKAASSSTYKVARFFSPNEVSALLASYGSPRVMVAAHFPSVFGRAWFSPIAQCLGRFLHPQQGAFIVGRVIL